MAAPAWVRFYRDGWRERGRDWDVPDGMVSAVIDPETGALAGENAGYDDAYLTKVEADGSVSWNRGSEIYRGWFAANGKCMFMMPTVILTIEDEPVITPDGFSLYFAIR